MHGVLGAYDCCFCSLFSDKFAAAALRGGDPAPAELPRYRRKSSRALGARCSHLVLHPTTKPCRRKGRPVYVRRGGVEGEDGRLGCRSRKDFSSSFCYPLKGIKEDAEEEEAEAREEEAKERERERIPKPGKERGSYR